MSSASGTTLEQRRAQREAMRVGSGDARSWLLVNALLEERFDEAQLSRADEIILDLEDAVDGSLKDRARGYVVDWLAAGGRAWVRVNGLSATGDWAADLEALHGLESLAGVMLAKTEDAAQVTDTYQRLGGRIPVIPLVESALGIEEAVHIGKARGAFRLAFGSGDYRRDTGAANDPLAMAYPRSRLVVASRIGGLPGPIDGPAVGSTHLVVRERTAESINLGMTGKLALDLDQPAVINEMMSPSPADLAWALDFLAEFERGGSVVRDGSDKPRLARAETIMRRAETFRISPA